MFVNISSDSNENKYLNTNQICEMNEYLKPNDSSIIIYQIIIGSKEYHVSKEMFLKLADAVDLENYKSVVAMKKERRTNGVKTMADLEKEIKNQWR